MRSSPWGGINKNKEEKIVKIRQWKHSHLTTSIERNFVAHQEALLAAVILDRRHNAWALEMLRRGNAVARWRGQPGCSVRENIQTLDALPTPSVATAPVELPKDALIQLEAA
jgi:hypothetical protein